MDIEIIDKELRLNISGFSGIATEKNYAGTAFALMDKIWPVVKAKGIKHKGLNIWVYESGEKVFAGVEIENAFAEDTGLEQKTVILSKYAYCKHIGPYNKLKQTSDDMRSEIRRHGLRSVLPYVEIYGHWTNDETKLETELLIAVDSGA